MITSMKCFILKHLRRVHDSDMKRSAVPPARCGIRSYDMLIPCHCEQNEVMRSNPDRFKVSRSLRSQ
jgi:hypothetical protein